MLLQSVLALTALVAVTAATETTNHSSAAQHSRRACKNSSRTCKGLYSFPNGHDPSVLFVSKCEDGKGGYQDTYVDLNDCLQNNFGNLIHGSGYGSCAI